MADHDFESQLVIACNLKFCLSFQAEAILFLNFIECSFLNMITEKQPVYILYIDFLQLPFRADIFLGKMLSRHSLRCTWVVTGLHL